MFAVQTIIYGKLYAVETADGSDSFHECFEQWQNPLFVREYLKSQPSTLPYFGVGLKEATKLIIKESRAFKTEIIDILKGERNIETLDNYIFKPLHKKDELLFSHVQAKAYGCEARSFTRLYAIRFSDGAYLVIGGLIKVHDSLQDSEEGKQMLAELKKWQRYLQQQNINDAFDLGILIKET